MTIPTTIISKPQIDISHQKIHEGNHFDIHIVRTGINIVNPKDILFIPPISAVIPSDTIEIHLIFSVTSNTGVTVQLFEGTTATDNGIAIDIINHNRRSSLTSLCEVFENPTVSDTGISIFIFRAGTATSAGNLALRRDEDEYILHPSTNYLLRITPLADNTDMTIVLDWYDNRPSSPVS